MTSLGFAHAMFVTLLAVSGVDATTTATRRSPIIASPLITQLDTWSLPATTNDGRLWFIMFFVNDCR
jgi:hypothetical protein